MKVAVITRHAITNYGSLLQAFATQKVIENLGYSCEIIDYIREDEAYTRQEKTLLAGKNSWNSNLIKKILYLILRQPESILAGKKFEKEREKYLNLSRHYNSINELSESGTFADVYMVGSDQVWGPVMDGTYDSAYCLAFVDDEVKKISYASSFGRSEMTSEKKKFFLKWLSRFDHISVREESAVKLLNEMGFDAAQVLDPTLLLDRSFWDAYAEPIEEKKYVLVYQLHNDPKLGAYAKNIARYMNLPLIRVSVFLHQIKREGKLIWTPSIGQFLSYVKNATCMVTDSFHGTAFAINYNTPFIEILPNNGTGTRNINILKMTGLSDRILHDYEDITLASKEIDFANANYVLEKERKYSVQILEKMISS